MANVHFFIVEEGPKLGIRIPHDNSWELPKKAKRHEFSRRNL